MQLNVTIPIMKRSIWLVMFSLTIGGCALLNVDKRATDEKIEDRVKQVENADAYDIGSTQSRKDFYLNRDYAVNQVLLKQAKDARDNGDFDVASALYKRVLGISPNNQFAHAGLASLEREKAQMRTLNTAKALLDQNKIAEAKNIVHQVLLENPQHPHAKNLSNQITEKQGSLNATLPQLKAKFNKPITLELRNADVKMVFDTLSRDTGINFILDKDIRPDQKANIFVKDLPIDEAIDMVISSNGLAKKVITENTVIIYPNNRAKLKAYQELLIRNFYLNNTKAKDVAALLKSMIKTKDIFVYERLNMLVMRDRPEVIKLAEKLVASIDLEDPEVMMEIEVLEVSRNRAQELGIVFPNQLSVLSTDTALTLAALKKVDSTTIGVSPNPAVNFRKTVGDLNLLSNPRIRVKNNEIAKILVGDKIPVITTTSTANVGISESVSYVDVGLKLEVEPRITLDNFVNIKVGLEVSTLGDKTVTSNGATVYAIGTRNTQTSLRLKDGETQILAGLILDDDRRTVSRLPGLGDVPLLGRLFSNNDTSNSKTEIVLAITPRILGNIPLPGSQNTEYWSGTANQVSDKIKRSATVGNSGGSTLQSTPKPLGAFDRLLQQRRQREAQSKPAPVTPDIDSALVPPMPYELKQELDKEAAASAAEEAQLREQGEAQPNTKDVDFIPGIKMFN